MSHQFPLKPLPCKSVQSRVRHFSLVNFSFRLHFGTAPVWYRAPWFVWALWWGDGVCFMSTWFQNIVFWCNDSNNFYIALYIVEQQKQNKLNRIIKGQVLWTYVYTCSSKKDRCYELTYTYNNTRTLQNMHSKNYILPIQLFRTLSTTIQLL